MVKQGVSPVQETDGMKPELAPVPIWRCRSAECKAWVRDELVAEPPPKRTRAKKGAKAAEPAPVVRAAAVEPTCPLCKGPMLRGMKHLPKLVTKAKAAPKPKDPWLH